MKPIDKLNHYELLNLEPSASPGRIRESYHLGLSTYGADSIAAHNLLSDEERAKMRHRLDKAYRILMDPETRAEYDTSLGITEGVSSKSTEVEKERPEALREGPRSFRGGDLKHYREALGISLESISHKTKIKTSHLEALESEHMECLPGLFFTRGFLKAYAACLRLNPDEVVNGYLGRH